MHQSDLMALLPVVPDFCIAKHYSLLAAFLDSPGLLRGASLALKNGVWHVDLEPAPAFSLCKERSRRSFATADWEGWRGRLDLGSAKSTLRKHTEEGSWAAEVQARFGEESVSNLTSGW